MAYNNNRQNGNSQPREEKVNQVTLIGTVCARSRNENDPIEYKAFQNGGGGISIIVKTAEPRGIDQATGQQKIRYEKHPVKIFINKNITEQMLRGIVAGMEIKVIGTLNSDNWRDKQTNEWHNGYAVEAYFLQIRQPAMMQGPYQQQPAYPQGNFAQQGQGYYQQPQNPYTQQGYAPQGFTPQPQYPPQYGQQNPYAPQVPAMNQPNYMNQQQAGAAAPQQASQIQAQQRPQRAPQNSAPQYYQPPQPQYQPPQPPQPPQQQVPAPSMEDMPADIC